MLWTRTTIVSILAVLSGCYFSSLNERPRPRIQEKTSGPYTLATEAVFSATGSQDDDGIGSLEAEWRAFNCEEGGFSCVAQGVRVRLSSTTQDFIVTPAKKGVLKIELMLIDSKGAREKTSVTLPVVNQSPSLEVQIDDGFADPGDHGGFVLGLPIFLATQVADPDGDDVSLTWNVGAPPGSVPESVIFGPVVGDEDLQELVGDVAGVWEVIVTADDGEGGAETATKQVVFAPDGPPCLGAIAPAASPSDIVVISSSARSFAVLTAIDSLDPWPALANPHPQLGTTTFQWSTSANGGPFAPLAEHRLSELVIDPIEHAPGDRLSVRVEITDRVPEHTVDCPTNEPTCSADQNACSQRMTWEAEIR